MKFSDLVFDKSGCCGTHAWAEVRHQNGIRSDVSPVEGGWTVVAFAGNVLMRGQRFCATEDEVEARLNEDALIES